MRDRRSDEHNGSQPPLSSRFRACAALVRTAGGLPCKITGPAAVQPRDCNQRHEKEFLHVSNEETTNTEEPRAQALAMRAGGRKKAAAKKTGRKKAAPKKAGRKAAPKKKAAGRKKAAAKKGYRKTAAKKKGGRKAAPKKKAAGRKKSGGRKKAAAAAAPTAESMPSSSDSMC